ncbi:hypothetical protein CR513_30817, partial [Mucuna pruriens]
MQPVQQSSLEELVKQMTTNNIQFQENDLQTQIGQLATTVNQLQSKGFGQIPSQGMEALRLLSHMPLSKFFTPIHSPYQPWEFLGQLPKVRPLPYRGITQSLPHQLAGIRFGSTNAVVRIQMDPSSTTIAMVDGGGSPPIA